MHSAARGISALLLLSLWTVGVGDRDVVGRVRGLKLVLLVLLLLLLLLVLRNSHGAARELPLGREEGGDWMCQRRSSKEKGRCQCRRSYSANWVWWDSHSGAEDSSAAWWTRPGPST